MVFSFFKKQPEKMPERQAAKPRPAAAPTAPAVSPATSAGSAAAPARPLPDLEFTREAQLPSRPSATPVPPAPPPPPPDALQAAFGSSDIAFSPSEFERSFTESSVMDINVDHDEDPVQGDVEQVVVLFANGQDAAARSLLETFIHAYQGPEGRRFWRLLFDLLQVTGDRVAFDRLCVDYTHACEESPPTWREVIAPVTRAVAADGSKLLVLQGVLTSDAGHALADLQQAVAQKRPVTVDCSRLAGCDDEIAGQWARLLIDARRAASQVVLEGIEGFLDRLDKRLVVGEPAREPSWQLLLELLQRHGSQERFEERAVDYAVTFEQSPPSWEAVSAQQAARGKSEPLPVDGAHYLTGAIANCRFDDLAEFFQLPGPRILDFSGVLRLDFYSAGQLVNRIAPLAGAGREIIIRSPNTLVAELMGVVGLGKQARILVPKH